MAEGKKAFLIYADWRDSFDALPDEEAGKLIKHIFSYVNDENPESDSVLIKAVFAQMKNQLKRDLDKWEKQIQQRKEAGRRSAEVRSKKVNEKKEDSTKMNDRSTTVNERQRNSTVTDNVTVIVTDNVNVKEKENKNNHYLCSIPDGTTLDQNEKITLDFWNLFKSNLLETGITKTTQLDKARLNDWSKHIRLMFEKDSRTLEEIRTVYKFLQISDFWKKNIQSTKKLREQFERLFQEAKTKVQVRSNEKSETEKRFGVDEEYLANLQKRLHGE
jgi:hypothetical protein